MTKRHAGVALGVFLVVAAWYVLANRGDDVLADCRQGPVAGRDIGGPFTLVNTAGQSVSEAEVLTGSADQVKAASQAYKTFYARRDTGDELYLMGHSTFTYLMLPGAGFVDFLRREITSGQMAESVACFVEAGKAAL